MMLVLAVTAMVVKSWVIVSSMTIPLLTFHNATARGAASKAM